MIFQALKIWFFSSFLHIWVHSRILVNMIDMLNLVLDLGSAPGYFWYDFIEGAPLREVDVSVKKSIIVQPGILVVWLTCSTMSWVFRMFPGIFRHDHIVTPYLILLRVHSGVRLPFPSKQGSFMIVQPGILVWLTCSTMSWVLAALPVARMTSPLARYEDQNPNVPRLKENRNKRQLH